MAIGRGYTNTNKEDRTKCEFVTVSPIGPDKYGLDIAAQKGVTLVASDAAEALSTNQIIVATGHAANVGDMVRFTSGGASGYEAVVYAKDTNTITLGQTLPATPGVGDTFNIYRSITQTLTATGTMPATMSFTRNGAAQDIVEDTVTPANNRPLPVRLMDFNGEMTLNATNMNLNVQLDHAGAVPDSVQIGDGTTILGITALGEAKVSVTQALPAGTNNIGDVDIASALPAGNNNIGDVDLASAIPAGSNVIGKVTLSNTNDAAINASNELQVRDDDAVGFLTTIDGDTGSLAGCVAGFELQVDVVAPLPAGTNNIGDVDIASIAAGTNNIGDVDVASIAAGTNVIGKIVISNTNDAAVNASNELQVRDDDAVGLLTTIDGDTGSLAGCVAGSELQVDIVAPIPAGTNNIGDVDVLTLPALPAGSNNIGDVDVLTLPSIPAGTNNIGDVDILSIAAGDNNIGNVDVVTLPNVTLNYHDIKNTAYIDFSSTNLPGNATNPAQLVASLSADVKKIQVFDTGGCFMEIMTGAAAAEVRKVLVGPGSNETVECAITSGTRVSVRRIDSANAAVVGAIAVNFFRMI